MAMIPDHDEHGLLPPGIHDATTAEIEQRFCWTPRRVMLLSGLQRLLAEWWAPQGLPAAVLVDGSFVRRKPDPDDIDAVFDLHPQAPLEQAVVFMLRCQCERADLKTKYHVDVWPRHPALPNDLAKFFQYLGDKAAAELQLDRTHPKGILRIVP
ncbi:DUF6932 family protein [Rhodocyclus purpureus]|uniref:DUF6932 family protein n=1 Tax=Rhodocyclus purpureus TaxID=1067 RepID=UPI001914CAB1|nr:hypothetical protein [Rhodocyclus purpureus]MBK5915130.1 hypothetical protein [Rhodocyclus purpureus]